LAPDPEAGAKQIERRWNELEQTTEGVSKCALAGAQFFIAREHGFTNWPRFARHIRELGHANSQVSAFEAAADAIVNGHLETLRQLLANHPGLVRERSTREHHSTLLHYVSANGIEDFRQKTPSNIVEIANLLLDGGAEVDAESDAYGGGCTTLGLVATIVHPEKAGVQIALLRTLLDRGANLRHPSSAGNRHSIVHGCLANGQPAAAAFLADLGAPLNPESAAALGRLDVLRSCFDETLAPGSEADRRQIESALLYACGYGRVEAARFLLERGADPAAHDDRGQSALHWAAWAPHVDVIGLLLERRAPVEVRDYRFHATPLDTALWTWANASDELARAGGKLDRNHWREAGEKDSPMLGRIDSDPRMLLALRSENA
jgi:ankyrin repeat protein